MIYVQNHALKEDEFVQLLAETKDLCLKKIHSENIKKMDGVPFENLVYQLMCEASKGTEFEGTVVQTGVQTFPDIIANKYFGTEVKVTADNKWSSTGNSVTESTRVKDVEKIYMFFGKFGDGADIKFRPYQEVLFAIGVTHSPRYKIDMNLAEGGSIFDKMGIEYDILRKETNPIKKIKDYYRSQLSEGEELWWIDSQSETTVNPVIRSLSKFSEQEKQQFMWESMVLFPEIFGSSRVKFERVAAYLITSYNAVTSNIRDLFSAGGQEKRNINGNDLALPRVMLHLFDEAKNIRDTIEKIEEEKLINYWRVDTLVGNRLDIWINMLDQFGNEIEGIKPSEIFEAGLNG